MSDTSRTEKSSTGVKPYKIQEFENYITWRALGGLIIDEDNPNSPNHARIMNLGEFCRTFKVDPKTVYNWKMQTPDLAELIEKRRNEIVPLSRVSAVWNQLYLTALQSKDMRAAVEAQKTFLGHYGNLQTPVQREVVTVGNSFADLIQAARNAEQEKPEIIEGEIVEDADQPEVTT